MSGRSGAGRASGVTGASTASIPPGASRIPAAPIRILLVDDQALVRSGFRIILESEPDLEVVGEAATGGEAVELAAQLRPDVICMDVEMPGMDGIEAARRILLDGAASSAGTGTGTGMGSGTGTGTGTGTGSGTGTGTGSGSERAGSPAILILTTFGHDRYLFDALAAGVSGFLLKTSRAEQLIDAVRALAAGHALLGPDVTRAVLERVAASPTGAPSDLSAGPAAAPEHRATAGQAPAAAEALAAAGLTDREREVLGLLAQGHSNGEIARVLFLGEATVKTHVSNLLQKLGVRDRIQAVVWAHTRGIA